MNTKTLLEQTTSFKDDLLKDLTDVEFAMYYLEAALVDYKEDGNMESLWMALRDVVEAQAAISELSKQTGIDAETLSDVLFNEDAPRLDILNAILNAFECQLPVQHKADANVSIKTAIFSANPLKSTSLPPLIDWIHTAQRAQRTACRFPHLTDQITVIVYK